MKRQEVFERTVDVLVKAYQNGTLEHGACQACAVGNLVMANCYNYDEGKAFFKAHDWYNVITTHIKGEQLEAEGKNPNSSWYRAIKEIESTGYSVNEVRLIEAAFEDACQTPDGAEDETGVHGLRAVYDVLLDIHEVDVDTVATAEEVFA